MIKKSFITDPRLKEAKDKFRAGLRRMNRQDGLRLAQLHSEYLKSIDSGLSQVTVKIYSHED